MKELLQRGTTALGPGLCVGLGMLNGAAPGSKIIVCTDGLANMGVRSVSMCVCFLFTSLQVGNIEETAFEGVSAFYRDLAERAKQRGVPINVISIAGTACKMEILV